MVPRIDHIQITVSNMGEAEPFYDALLPILGFDLARKTRAYVADHDFDVVEYTHESITIGINSPREAFRDQPVNRRKPGSLHHLAFRASNRKEVDTLFQQIKDIGAEIVHEPRFFPQHGERYYACYFKDPGGIKLEVMFEETAS